MKKPKFPKVKTDRTMKKYLEQLEQYKKLTALITKAQKARDGLK